MSRKRRRLGGRPGERPADRLSRRQGSPSRSGISWPLAVWLTPPASLSVFLLMIILTVAQPEADSSVITGAVASGLAFAVGGSLLLWRGGRRGRGVGLALIAGGLLAGILGVWAVIA